MTRRIWTDATWREPGTRPTGWQFVISQLERDTRARLIDRPPPTTMRDVLRMTTAPTWRTITRIARKCAAVAGFQGDEVMATKDDGGPAFAVWENYFGSYSYGTIEKKTPQTATVQPWRKDRPSEWDGPRRMASYNVTPVASKDDALELVKALTDLADRETATRRQYAEKRNALIAAARAKAQP